MRCSCVITKHKLNSYRIISWVLSLFFHHVLLSLVVGWMSWGYLNEEDVWSVRTSVGWKSKYLTLCLTSNAFFTFVDCLLNKYLSTISSPTSHSHVPRNVRTKERRWEVSSGFLKKNVLIALAMTLNHDNSIRSKNERNCCF